MNFESIILPSWSTRSDEQVWGPLHVVVIHILCLLLEIARTDHEHASCTHVTTSLEGSDFMYLNFLLSPIENMVNVCWTTALFLNIIPLLGSSLDRQLIRPVCREVDGSWISSYVFDVNHSRLGFGLGQASTLFSTSSSSKNSWLSTGPSLSMNSSYTSRVSSISIASSK